MTKHGGSEPSDEVLIERALEQDQAAFGALVWRHQAAVRAFLGRFSRDAAVVDDLAQEAFVSAYHGLAGFERQVSLRMWLFGIARNKWLVFQRGEARRSKRQAKKLELELARWQTQRSEREVCFLDHEQELAALEACLDQLPPRSAELVRAHYFEDQTAAAIAEAEGRKPSAVRMTLLRAREALRACVEQRVAGERA